MYRPEAVGMVVVVFAVKKMCRAAVQMAGTAATALTTALTDLGVSTQTSDDNLVTI